MEDHKTTYSAGHMQAISRNFCAFFLSLLLLFQFAGCTLPNVQMVASYDPVTDRSIQDLSAKTEVVIKDVTQTQAPFSKYSGYYSETDASLRELEIRTAATPKNEEETHLIKNLRAAVGNLKRTHEEVGPFRVSEAEGVRSLFRTLISLEKSKSAVKTGT
jgi:hypothetical protein